MPNTAATPTPQPPPSPLVYAEYQENAATPMLARLAPKSFINWTPEYDTAKNKWLKVPIQKTNEPAQHLTLQQALARQPQVGLVCNTEHPVIALDIDGIALSEEPLQSLLQSHPTYIEHSPSGKENYYRVLYQLPTAADKEYLKSKTTYKQRAPLAGQIDFFNRSQNYITLTGQAITTTAAATTENTQIATITPADLIQHFPQFAVTHQEPSESAQATSWFYANTVPVPIPQWAEQVAIDRNDPLVQNYCEKQGLTYYEFWLHGLMALHAVDPGMTGLMAADKWSSKSAEYDHDEVRAKWASFTSQTAEQHITAGTYMYMYNHLTIQWPVTNKNGSPSLVSFDNFEHLINKLGIGFAYDAITGAIVVTGPESLLIPHVYANKQEYYTRNHDASTLKMAFFTYTRKYNYRIEPDRIQSYLSTIISNIPAHCEVNRMEEFLLDQPPYDPTREPDYLDIIFGDCLINDPDHNNYYPNPDRELRVKLGRIWARSLLRTFSKMPIKYKHHRAIPAEGMLILSGANSNIGKSTFCKNFLPEPFSRYLYEPTTDMGRIVQNGPTKDYRIGGTTSLLINFDECGWLFRYTQLGSDFIKQEVTGTVDQYRPLYAKTDIERLRRYSLIASTNDTAVQLPRQGARRFFWINVTDIDRLRYISIDKVRVFKQIEYEIAQHNDPTLAPWAIDSATKAQLESYLVEHQTTSNLEELLEEVFHTEPYAINKRLAELKELEDTKDFRDITYCTQDIFQMLNFEGQSRPKIKEFKITMERFLTKYMPKEWYFKRTKFKNGIPPKRSGQMRFLLPPLRSAEGYYDPSEE